MHILIIEDNTTISENISLYLTAKGYHTDIASDGERAFDMLVRKSYDFLIIDRMIPRIDWLSLVRLMQSKKITIPFLFLTALGKQVDRIEWLSLGADDYLVKPFDLEELRLRIDNIMRRHGYQSVSTGSFVLREITIDTAAKQVTQSGMPIDFSPKEYAILELLLENRGKILDREYIYTAVWGENYDHFSNVLDTVNVHIAYIRKKIWNDTIRTIKLSGYIIDAIS